MAELRRLCGLREWGKRTLIGSAWHLIIPAMLGGYRLNV